MYLSMGKTKDEIYLLRQANKAKKKHNASILFRENSLVER